MRMTEGPEPPERTKMSTPSATVIVCVLKVDGKAACAPATCAESNQPVSAAAMVRTCAFVVMEPLRMWCLGTTARKSVYRGNGGRKSSIGRLFRYAIGGVLGYANRCTFSATVTRGPVCDGVAARRSWSWLFG